MTQSEWIRPASPRRPAYPTSSAAGAEIDLEIVESTRITGSSNFFVMVSAGGLRSGSHIAALNPGEPRAALGARESGRERGRLLAPLTDP